MKRLRIAASLSRIELHYKSHDTGTISAFRDAKDCGEGEKISRTENRSRNRGIRGELISKGYGVTSIKGVFIENYGSNKAISVYEESYFVVDLRDNGSLKKDLIKLGQLYEQDCITYAKARGEYCLISTNKCPDAYPGRGKIGVELKVGKPYFGGKPLTDDEIKNKVSPENSMRILGQAFSLIRGRAFEFKTIAAHTHATSRIDGCIKMSIGELRSCVHFAKGVKKALGEIKDSFCEDTTVICFMTPVEWEEEIPQSTAEKIRDK